MQELINKIHVILEQFQNITILNIEFGIIIYYLVILGSICYSLNMTYNYYFDNSESKSLIGDFLIFKGKLYMLLALVTLIFTFIVKDVIYIIATTSICIAIFEAIQNIVQGKAEKDKAKLSDMLENNVSNDLKHVEKLDTKCRTLLMEAKNNSTEKNLKLVYEQLYDYLKYYEEAEDFLLIFKAFMRGKKSIEDVQNAETQLVDELKYECIYIVKIPE